MIEKEKRRKTGSDEIRGEEGRGEEDRKVF